MTVNLSHVSDLLPVHSQVMFRKADHRWYIFPEARVTVVDVNGIKYFRLTIHHFCEFAPAARSMVQLRLRRWPFSTGCVEVTDGSKAGGDGLCCLLFDHVWFKGVLKEFNGSVGLSAGNVSLGGTLAGVREILTRESETIRPFHKFKVGIRDTFRSAIPSTWRGRVVSVIVATFNEDEFNIVGITLVPQNVRLVVYRDRLSTVGQRPRRYDDFPLHLALLAAAIQQNSEEQRA